MSTGIVRGLGAPYWIMAIPPECNELSRIGVYGRLEPVTCRSRRAVWVNAGRRLVRRPASGLAPVGIAFLGLGLYVGDSSQSLPLVGIGAAIVVLAVVWPFVSDVELGVPGASIKLSAKVKRREESVRAAISPEIRRRSQNFAEMLTGDVHSASELLRASVDSALIEWTEGEPRELYVHIVCGLVRLYLSDLNTIELPNPKNVVPRARRLQAVPPLPRAIVLLSENVGLSIHEIEHIIAPRRVDVAGEVETAHELLKVSTP